MSSYKVVVLGSSGVGKSSFVNLLCAKDYAMPSSTVGCAVSVIVHQYHAGSADEHTELIELWDIGGSMVHQKASIIFLEGASGAILVHDLTNKKSESNLSQWVSLLHGDASSSSSLFSTSNVRPLSLHIESAPIPTLIVGCKSDLAPHRAKQASYDRINVDCRHPIPPSSTNRIMLSKFFDSVVERKKMPSSGEKRRRLLPLD